MIESDLIRRAQQGDRAALEDICRQEWRPVYELLYRSVQNRAEAQDLTQEVFLRAVRSFDRYQVTDASIHKYLVTIALNLLRDRWRRKTPPSADIASVPNLPASGPGPEQTVLADLDRRAVQDALRALPEDYQTVIRLRVLEARSSKEVADLMGRNPDAVRQLQCRALAALRVSLRKESLA